LDFPEGLLQFTQNRFGVMTGQKRTPQRNLNQVSSMGLSSKLSYVRWLFSPILILLTVTIPTADVKPMMILGAFFPASGKSIDNVDFNY